MLLLGIGRLNMLCDVRQLLETSIRQTIYQLLDFGETLYVAKFGCSSLIIHDRK